MSTALPALHLNLLVDSIGFDPLPRAGQPTALAWYARIATLAERGGFDAITLLDRRAIDPHDGPGAVRLEAQTVLAALAPLTQRIGLVAQVATQHTQPYNTARRLASLDHASQGRAGWLVAERSGPHEAANFDHDDAPDALARSQEYVEVLRRLWDSWRDDARVIDKVAGQYVDVRRIQPIDHVGAAFRVAGPIDIPRPPQGHPVVLREGTVSAASDFRDADAVIVHAADAPSARAQRQRLGALGRPPLALPRVGILCSPSDARRARSLDRTRSRWPAGVPLLAGAPHAVAQTLIDWVDSGAADGFSLCLPTLEDDLADVTEYLVPELVRLGRLPAAPAGVTLRGHLGLARPAGRTGTAAHSAQPAAA